MMNVRCPVCGEEFEVDPNLVFPLNRFYCAVCNMLLEVLEDDPIVLNPIDDDDFEEEDMVEDADGAGI